MFSGKAVIITGASSGIGFETALYFAKLEADLTLTGRNPENLQKVGEECEKLSKKKPVLIIGDLTQETVINSTVEETVKQFGRLDVLINNAGVLESGSIENTSTEQLDRIFDINVRSLYKLTILAVPHLIKTKGNIVNVSSVAGTRSFPGILAYGMSKAAVDQFTKSVALELAPKGIRVNSVNPGVIITEIHKRGGMSDKDYEAFLVKCKETHALGRPGNASEVASTIAFLASDGASFITGELIHVDGGRHAMCPR